MDSFMMNTSVVIVLGTILAIYVHFTTKDNKHSGKKHSN